MDWLSYFSAFLTVTLTSIVLILFVWAVYTYFKDKNQTVDSIRYNFPVIGRFRSFFIYLGEFFRQYFFAADRDELPFNRASRQWVYEKSKGKPGNISFGSTYDLRHPGALIFVNSPYAILEGEHEHKDPRVIGQDRPHPFQPKQIVNISGMSFGALSGPAISALSLGAAKSGIWFNTGEGGLSEYHQKGGCDLVFQIGTAKYGVQNPDGSLSEEKLKKLAENPNIKAFEIKMSQGAKPGKGGILPGAKVTAEIARIRGIPEGEDSISPNRQPEVSNPDELLDMIDKVQRITGKPVGMKTVVSAKRYPRRLMKTILRRGIAPDFITIDGGDGGTGAAPQVLADHVGLPLRESLPMMADLLIEYGLKDKIRLVASGRLITPDRIAWALCVGADYVVTARGFMLALGCIQAMQCGKDTCPTGITTHDKKLQKGLHVINKSERVKNYGNQINKEINTLAHSCGVKAPQDFNRNHVRIVVRSGFSKLLSELHPLPESKDYHA